VAELRTLVGVDLIRVGSWEASTGAFIPTPGDLAAAVAAFDAGVLRKPILKLGHVDPRFDGEPAVGFVDHLRLSDGGRTLLGDFAAVPAWLADVMASAYPDRSIEGRYDYADPTGRVWPFLLTAVALIGVAAPAIGSLQSLQDRYGLAEPVAASFTGRAVHITTARHEPILPSWSVAACWFAPPPPAGPPGTHTTSSPRTRHHHRKADHGRLQN